MYAEAVSVDLMTLILAYNLHHRNNVQNNVLMQALIHENIQYPEVLLEKVLLFFNRGGKWFIVNKESFLSKFGISFESSFFFLLKKQTAFKIVTYEFYELTNY